MHMIVPMMLIFVLIVTAPFAFCYRRVRRMFKRNDQFQIKPTPQADNFV